MAAFTVIIPTKNREDFLKRAVTSVLDQQSTDFELLIVNDGEALQLRFDDPRIRILDNDRRGAVPARNFGVSQAQGENIAFLDDDDHWTDTAHLSQAQNHLASTADFYFGDGKMLFPDGTEKSFAHEVNLESLKNDNTILISAVCYKTSLHKDLGMFDEALPYYWDWDWYLRVAAAKYRLFRQAKYCVNIVVHTQNMSGGGNISLRRANLDLFCEKHKIGFILLKNHTDFV